MVIFSMNNLYSRENMLDHLKNPRNKGTLLNPDVELKVVNRHCGDILNLYANVNDGKITNISFDGEGCAVALSSASMLIETLQGSPIKDLDKISRNDVLANFGNDLTPSRQNCALLVFDGVKQLVDKIKK